MIAKIPLIVITGPTGSGKTALAIEVARRCNGEIICADSRAIYKGMDIGTAKPTAREQEVVPHWGIDLVEPGDRYTASDFKSYALQKIAEIRGRGRVPLLVGGTGLYIDGVVFDYSFAGKADPALRARLEAMTLQELYEYCVLYNVNLPENKRNKRYVIRTIERQSISTIKKKLPLSDTFIVGIATDMKTLRKRLQLRSEHLFDNGVVDEARILGKRYGWHSEAMTGNIYPLIKQHLDGALSMSEARERFVTLDYQLAKRQMTWFRRNPYILWVRYEEVLSILSGAIRS